jgi:protein O-GlcNAc transferase
VTEPDDAVLLDRAGTLVGTGRPDLAAALLADAIRRRPAGVSVHRMLGRLLAAGGRPREALDAFLGAIRAGDRDRDTFVAGVAAARAAGDPDQAVRLARAALQMPGPPDWRLRFNLALTLIERRQIEPAVRTIEEMLADFPDGTGPDPVADLLNDAASLRKEMGDLDGALALYRKALRIRPSSASIRSNLLLCLAYHPGVDPAERLAEHKTFGALFDRPFDPFAFPNVPDPDRRLRVGIVSPDLRRHVVAVMIEECLGHVDPDRIAIVCYAEVTRPDEVTERLRAKASAWRSTVGLDDEAVAAMIRADRIDVLIDLAGHTANNRLPVFGLKPAPVQMSWLGYPCTTGMRTIDWLGTHLPADQIVEAPIGTPAPVYQIRAPDMAMPPPPVLARGHPTFGCFNNASKVNDAVLALWARLLLTVPTARLILKAVGFHQPEAREQVARRFAAHGVDPGRIAFRGPSAYRDFLAETADLDVALDPFPYSGSTTTLDLLWMGVPTVTLRSGDPRAASPWVLETCGLDGLVAATPEAYVAIASDLVRDPDALAALRSDLRIRLQSSGLTDPRRMAEEFEAMVRKAWRAWVEQRRAASPG